MNSVQIITSNIFGSGVPVFNRVTVVEIQLQTITLNAPFQFPNGSPIGIDKVLVYGLQTFTADQQSLSAGGKTVIPAAGASSLMIDLVDDNSDHRINNTPYYNWISSLNLGYPYMFNPFRLVMDKSNVIIVNTANLTVNQVALVGLLYFTEADLVKLLTPEYGAAQAQTIVNEYYETL
jgi:hypothetical protein